MTNRDLYRNCMAANPDAAMPGARVFDSPPDESHFTAPKRLSAPNFMRSNAYLKQGERANWAQCDPRLMFWAASVVYRARQMGIPLYVHTALRGRAEQNRLKAAGRSRAAYGRSAHNIGEAVDIVHGCHHWQMSEQEWNFLHTLGLRVLDRVNARLRAADKLELTWGGNFRSLYDPAHWEISDFRQRLRPLPDAEPIRKMPIRILNDVGLTGLLK